MEIGLTLLAQSGLSPKFWVDAFLTAIFLINRLPSPVLQHESPFSKLMQRSPDYTVLRAFGCLCYPLLRPYATHKLSFRSKPCIFIGYGGSHKGYRCLDPTTNKVFLSRHVIFDETQFPAKAKSISQGSYQITASSGNPLALLPNSQFSSLNLSSTDHFSQQHVTPSVHTQPITASLPQLPLPTSSSPPPLSTQPLITNPIETEGLASNTQLQPDSAESNVSASTSESSSPDTNDSSSNIQFQPESAESNDPQPETSHSFPQPFLPHSTITLQVATPNRIVTRSQTGHLKPKEYPGFKMLHTIKYPLLAFHTVQLPPEPSTYKQAASKPEWTQAMLLEYNALVSNQTWTLCPRPSHHNVVRNKWVFKLKQKPDGSIDRFKSRLVAKGYEQLSGVDYYETFSPVIKTATVRLILALAVQFDWTIKQLDVSNAFLHGILDEEVYMEQPQGFIDPVFPDYVCKLHKSIYGLKQAPRAWFTRLSHALQNLGFCGSQVDHSLFVYHLASVHIYLLVYVDDIILTGNHEGTMNRLIDKLKHDFAMKDLGPLGYFLGIQATKDSGGLHLRQSKYVLDLLNRTHMAESKPYRAPCAAGSKMSKYDGEPLSDPAAYRHIVGALQYVTLTRPDIAYSINQLCQHMHAPTTTHLTAAKRVLRYLKGTLNSGLYVCKGPITLTAFCDADWAGNPDDRRSTTGYGVFLGPNLISWSAKKQHIVSRSSTEAEYRSLSLTTAELFWLRMLLKELQISLPSPPVIWCDNSSALALASNPVFHARTKHIEVDVHFIRGESGKS
jgi:hypothetical protein